MCIHVHMCVCACARVCVFCVCLSIYIYMYIIHKSTRKYVHTYSIASAGVASSVCGRLPPFVHHKCHILTAHIIFRYQYTYIHSHTHTHTHGHTHTHSFTSASVTGSVCARLLFIRSYYGHFRPTFATNSSRRARRFVCACLYVCVRARESACV